MNIKKEFIYQEYLNRENGVTHAPYNPELTFYSAISQGNVNAIKSSLKSEPLSKKAGLGQLSLNPVQNLKYHFAITSALASRYCINNGMEHTSAYHLSDFYIKKADTLNTTEEISNLHSTMCIDYAKRMEKLLKQKVDSIHIIKCLDYIYEHLNTKISMDILSEYVNLSPNYLSRLFKQQTGYTVSQYIQRKKIETAQNMLIYSDYTPVEISEFLAFPNQSYFTSIFHKLTGMTPSAFRRSHIRDHNIKPIS